MKPIVDLSVLSGLEVSQCIVDVGFSLRMARATESALLRIEGSFRLRLDKEWVLDPETEPSSLAPALGLLGRTIDSAGVRASGELELSFSGDAWLLVNAGREYEAWTLSLPDNTLIVSGTDGEVSVFGANPTGR